MSHISDPTASTLSSDFVIDVWHRRKWIAVAVFSAAAAGAFTLSRCLPNLYRASATVLVERAQVSEAFVRPSVTAELETRIQSIHQQLMSRARLTELIDRFGLYPELKGVAPMDGIVGRMRRDITLDPKDVQQSTGLTATIAFTLSYMGRDPEAVAQVVNTLVGFYVDENTKNRERQAARTAEFLKAQLAEVKATIDAQERRTSEFKIRHGVELPEQLASNLAALERLNAQLRLNGEYQIRAMERRERLEQQFGEAMVARRSERQETPTPTMTELATLRRELAELRTRFSDQYPDIIQVKARIAALENQVAVESQATGRGTNGHTAAAPVDPTIRLKQSLAAAAAELASLREEEQFLRRLIAGYEERIESAPRRQQQLQQLSRDYETTKEHYATLLKRYEEAQLTASLEQHEDAEHFQVLDPAIPPAVPAAPDRRLLLVMGLLASLGLAFAAVVAAERLDTTFHTVEDLRAYVPSPAPLTVRVILTSSDVRQRRRRFALLALLVMAGVFLAAAATYYVADGNEQIVRRMARVGG